MKEIFFILINFFMCVFQILLDRIELAVKVTEFARFENNYFGDNSFITSENYIAIATLDFGNCAIFCTRLYAYSLLAEVSHDVNDGRETSAGFRRVIYPACARVSLTTSDVFVTCDTTQITGFRIICVFPIKVSGLT